MLAEATTKEISKKETPLTFDESIDVAKRGGKVAGNTRRDIESQIGSEVISSKNANDLQVNVSEIKSNAANKKDNKKLNKTSKL
jgi:hypothetical protein